MTRIIAGTAKGRRLTVPPRGTRPTSDRVREAIFSALSARIDLPGAAVLDLYAGSGALALEALSRGAARAVLVDSDAKAAAVISANVGSVGLAGATVRRASVAAVLAGPAEPFDVVFLDPPYDLAAASVNDHIAVLANGWLAPGAAVVVERSARSDAVIWPPSLHATVSRKYGETRIDVALWHGGALWQDQQA